MIAKTRTLFTAALLAGALALAGCGGDGAGTDDGKQPTDTPETPAVALPDGLFVTAAPEGALHVSDVKENAKEGDEVVVRGRVGGVLEPFTKGRAVLMLADIDNIVACSDRTGDNCEYPWDYCCEPPDELMKNTLTVQVVGDDGRPLKADLEGVEGLAGLSFVTVKGKVGPRPDPKVLVINATAIHIEK